jgi:chemotaxis response regulator CheB
MTSSERIKEFPIVCVGGETPDLEPFTELVRRLPADLGAAIVIIDHVKHMADRLLGALASDTQMPVELITDGLSIQPNRVFLLERGHDLHVLDGKFRLTPVSKPTGWSDVITVFLRSLIHRWEGPLVAVILSGMDGDGAAALCELKSAGGFTIVQELESAVNGDMPRTAIMTGCVDSVLTIENIAGEIARIARAVKTEVGKPC